MVIVIIRNRVSGERETRILIRETETLIRCEDPMVMVTNAIKVFTNEEIQQFDNNLCSRGGGGGVERRDFDGRVS